MVDQPGSGATNTVDFSGVTVPLTFQFGDNLSITDGTDTVTQKGTAINQLIGSSNADTFYISGNRTANWFGRGGNDRFVFADGAHLTGTLNGESGLDTLDLSAFSSPVSVTLSGAGGGTSTAITGTFTGLEAALGGCASNLLTGPDSGATFTISGTNAGNVSEFNFSAFQNLKGGAGHDIFVFGTGGSLDGNIDGGPGSNGINYSADASPATVDLQTGQATGLGGSFTNIQSFTGNTGATLVGPDSDSEPLISPG